MAGGLPADIEQQVREFQQLQRTLQTVVAQKQQLTFQIEEIKLAAQSVNSATGMLFKAAGGLLIQISPEFAKKELSEKQESFELRLTMLGKQEKQLSEKAAGLKATLEAALKKMPSE
ncbi:prefoldin subunit beta [Candidatus Parvarchaeota archaeon]|nr:prefoldin subunit beta [Candidatus Parvarchaeota archaeon]